jgi:pimeloyl-ACP methyl ester carboxylesterase
MPGLPMGHTLKRPVPRTLVLVHGAWHGPWCWQPVVPSLERAGLRPVAVELPMRRLAEDIELVREAIVEARGAGAVAVLGHSYAGQVISGAGHDADQLIYVAATAPEGRSSVFEDLGDAMAAIPGLELGDEHILFTRASLPAFYGRCSADVQEWALERVRPFGTACAGARLEVKPAWETVPSTYVVCTEDQALPPAYQRERAAAMESQIELEADHSPFCSATADLLTAILRSTGIDRPHAHIVLARSDIGPGQLEAAYR